MPWVFRWKLATVAMWHRCRQSETRGEEVRNGMERERLDFERV
jgi:hypothetical protein